MKKTLFGFIALSCVAVCGVASAEVALPGDYTPLAWVASDGYQDLDTGVPVSESLQVEADVVFHNYHGEVSFGAIDGLDANDWRFMNYENGLIFDCGNTRLGNQAAGRLALDTRYVLRFGVTNGTVYVAAEVQATGASVASYQAALVDRIASGRFRAFRGFGQQAVYGLKCWDFVDGDRSQRALLRDFVPCRNPAGVAGLWDKVNGTFYGSTGEDELIGSDEGAVMFNYLSASTRFLNGGLAGPFIDTGVTPTYSLQVALDFTPLADTGDISMGMWGQSDPYSWRMFTHANGFYFDCGGTGSATASQIRIGPKDKLNGIHGLLEFGCDDTNTFAQFTNLKTGEQSERYTAAVGTNPFAAGTIGVFGGNKSGAKPFAMTLYSLRFTDKNGSGERVTTHDFVPYRNDDGRYGLFDKVTGDFKPNTGVKGGFVFGYAYTTEGTTLRARSGTLTDEDSLTAYTAVEKTSRHVLNAGARTAFPTLTVAEGTLSLADGVSRTTTVAGALTLKGGTRLVFDVIDAQNDALAASSLALVDANAEHPIKIETRAYGRTLTGSHTLLTGGALTAADLAKFTLKSETPAHLEVADGNLVFVADAAPAEPELPAGYRRLDFVESSASQIVDTGVYVSPQTVVDMTVSFPVLPGEGAWYSYMGGRYGAGHTHQFGGWIYTKNGATWHYSAVRATESTSSIPVAIDTPYQVHLEKNGPCLVDGQYMDVGAGAEPGRPIYLFAICQNGSTSFAGNSRIHGCRIATKIDDGVLRIERDYVPVLREADGEIGFYERVSGTFVGRNSGGTFGAGLPAAITGTDYTQTAERTTVNGVDLTGTLTWSAGTLAVAETAVQEIRCGALQLAGGTLAFATLGEGTPEIKVAGAATVTGPVTVTLPPALAEGTYALISAQSFSLAGGSIALADGCAVGTDGATRTLETTATGVLLVIGAQTMPAGYQRLEFIRSTGRQFLNTGTEIWELSSIDFRFSGLSQVDHKALFGQDKWENSRFMLDIQSPVLYFHGPATAVRFDIPPIEATCRFLVGADTYGRLTRSDLEEPQVRHTQMTFNGLDRTLNLFSTKGDLNHACQYAFHEMRIAYEGELQRYFVPCRNPAGELGLWDFVEGRFFGNEGEGQFQGPCVTGAYLNYAESTGKQRVLTDYPMDTNTVVKFSFGKPVYANGTAFFGLAWTGSCYLFNQQNNLFYFHGSGNAFNSAGLPDPNARYTFELGDDDLAVIKKVGSNVMQSLSVSRAVTGSADNQLAVFDVIGGGKASSYRFYSLDLGKAAGEGARPWPVTWDARLVPYRSAEGEVGLLDDKSGKFYPAMGTSLDVGEPLRYGYAFNPTENGVVVYDGVIEVEDAFAVANVRKEGSGTIQMGLVTSFTTLDVAEGCFSLRDGVARTTSVSGTLTLAGGTRLAFDVTPGGYDRVSATTINLAEASVENPVIVDLTPSGWGTFSESGKLALLSANNLTAADAEKFTVYGLEATLSVENGTLVATLPPAIPLTAQWTGAGDRTRVDDPANWVCFNAAGQPIDGMLPTNVTTIVLGATTDFNFPAGQTLFFRDIQLERSEVTLTADCDWRGLNLPIDFKVNLAGHTLRLASLAGTGTITDGVYQRLDFIRSTGTQWINTEVLASSTLQAEMDFASHAHTGDITVGVNNQNNDNVDWRFFDYEKGVLFDYGNNRSGSTSATPLTLNTRYVAQFGREVNTVYNRVYVKGNDIPYADYSVAASATVSAQPIGIFGGLGANNAVKYAQMSLYSLKLTDLVDGERVAVRDFVPVRKMATDELGLLDLANDVFYPNNGTGVFTAGFARASGEVGGSVVVDVPAGAQLFWQATDLNLMGTVKLVKTGEGTFYPQRDGATYAGGTEIRAGVLQLTGLGTTHRLGALGSEITVRAGAAVELASNYDFYDYVFTLDGGELRSTIGTVASGASKAHLAHVNITSNATMTSSSITGFIGSGYAPTVLDLQGHELEVNIPYAIYLSNLTSTPGKIVFRGRWCECYNKPVDLSASTVEVHGNFIVNKNVTEVRFGDYIVCTTDEEDNGEGNATSYTSPIFVHGTFKPVTTRFSGCTLIDGAKIDLSDFPGTFDVVSTTKRTLVPHTLLFAEGATIGIMLGDRRVRNEEKLIAWTPSGTDEPAVKAAFTAEKRPDVLLEVREDGLYAISNSTIIFIR
ncbi:MAG: hypothetical protein MJ249_07235 [Kiritimatiellae bacterium]|nr:hypothetical protein [Kiritimatiellia bacterium]